MNNAKLISRRRFITLSACAVGCALSPIVANAHDSKSFIWKGEILGGFGSVKLVTDDLEQARLTWKTCLEEIDKLEEIFSLYRSNSFIRRLNQNGRLDEAPPELLEVISKSLYLSKISNGAFDVSVQPLWHYLFYNEQKTLSSERIAELKSLIDYQSIKIEGSSIYFLKPGMAITLNGVAQGFVTDRVTQIFRKHGFANILVETGEIYASGSNQKKQPWQIAIENPERQGITRVIELSDMAISTSGGYGTPFDSSGKAHHLIDVKTATSANRYKSVSVIADNATDADGLSTTLSLVEQSNHEYILSHFPSSSAYVLGI